MILLIYIFLYGYNYLLIRFFQWCTVWLPNQLALEYDQDLWVTVKAPVDAIFEDSTVSKSIWKRLVYSLL